MVRRFTRLIRVHFNTAHSKENPMIRIAKIGVAALFFSASSAYAAAPTAVVAAVSGACCAIGICCGLPCCDGMSGMAM